MSFDEIRACGTSLSSSGAESTQLAPREAALPGMGEYARVRDYREQALARMPNVEVFRESRLSADDVLAVGADHVAIATGAAWRRDRFDGQVYVPVADNGIPLLTPDGIMAGQRPVGRTLVYDEDGYYMGGIIAAALCAEGFDVTLATPSEAVSNWAGKTSERWKVRTRLRSTRFAPASMRKHPMNAMPAPGWKAHSGICRHACWVCRCTSYLVAR